MSADAYYAELDRALSEIGRATKPKTHRAVYVNDKGSEIAGPKGIDEADALRKGLLWLEAYLGDESDPQDYDVEVRAI